ncbi:MAG: LptF/LptG family permease [Bacteroidales bacterium]|nr:LptF/LptG family permease [Bacteroidales bacterium]
MVFIKKIHGLIIKSFLTLFVPSFLITIFVLILQFIWLYADDLVGKGLTIGVLSKLIYYLSLMNVTMAMPIAVMLASIMTFGNMGENFELTAAKSAGISLFRIMSPIFVIAILFSGISFFFANNVFPYVSLKTYTLVASIRQQHPALRIQEGIFNYDVPGYVIRVGQKSKTSQMMYDFMIYDHVNYQGNKFVIVSDSGTVNITENLQYMIITLYSGAQYEEQKEDETKLESRQLPYYKAEFEQQEMIIPLNGFDFKENDMSLYSQNYNMLNVRQLREKIDSLDIKYNHKIEYYFDVILNNDILKNQIKFRTSTDSASFFELVGYLNIVPPDKLTVFYNIDSAFNNQTLHNQKELMKMSMTNAENLYNRINVFQAEFNSRREWLVEHKIAIHKKFVFALACFIFFFIGAPLGSIIRKGGFGLPTIISVILFLIFYVILTFGEKFARDGVMSAFVGIWMPILIFIPFEIYLFYKATTDSVILNYDYYRDVLDKFFKKFTPNFLRKKQYRTIRKKIKNRRRNELNQNENSDNN